MNIVFAELKSIPYSNLTVVIDSPTPPLTPLYGLHHRIVCVLKSAGHRGRMSRAENKVTLAVYHSCDRLSNSARLDGISPAANNLLNTS